jgi:hypothetical protein
VAPVAAFPPAASIAAAAKAERRGQVGSASETCATRPVPKKLVGRATVRSMNWSTTTKRPGGSSSRSDPTEEMASKSVAPSRLSASTLARALISDGGMRCPAPWRGRKSSRVVPIRPSKMVSDGAPHGVSTSWRAISSSPGSA